MLQFIKLFFIITLSGYFSTNTLGRGVLIVPGTGGETCLGENNLNNNNNETASRIIQRGNQNYTLVNGSETDGCQGSDKDSANEPASAQRIHLSLESFYVPLSVPGHSVVLVIIN